MNISLSNKKLGGHIPSINLPPITTCRCNAPCKKDCYACKGNFRYPKVQQSMNENLTEFLNDGETFFNTIINYINNGLVIYKYVRWFSAGDIVSKKFFEGMVKVAKTCKHTKFLAFTKKFEIVNDYIANGGQIPSNLKIVFSRWDKDFIVNNPYKFPESFVNFKDSKRNPEIPFLSFPCNGDCSKCLSCWNLKKGQSVVFNQH